MNILTVLLSRDTSNRWSLSTLALGLLIATTGACPSSSPVEPADVTSETVVDAVGLDAVVDIGLDAVTETLGDEVTELDGTVDALETSPPLDVDAGDTHGDGDNEGGASETIDGGDPQDAADDGNDSDADDVDNSPDSTDSLDGDETASGPLDTVWGPISGSSCGGLSDALASPDPSFHVNSWAFTVETFDPSLLQPDPFSRYQEPNAGGSSKCSEVMSMTWLMECQAGVLYKKETEIIYDTEGAITDYAMTVDGAIIGVSVTRAYLGPFNQDYTIEAATTLLDKKLEGINESSQNVSSADAWTKQILHVWTLQPDWVPTLEAAWQGLSDALKADTVVLVTVEEGSDYIVTDSCDD